MEEQTPHYLEVQIHPRELSAVDQLELLVLFPPVQRRAHLEHPYHPMRSGRRHSVRNLLQGLPLAVRHLGPRQRSLAPPLDPQPHPQLLHSDLSPPRASFQRRLHPRDQLLVRRRSVPSLLYQVSPRDWVRSRLSELQHQHHRLDHRRCRARHLVLKQIPLLVLVIPLILHSVHHHLESPASLLRLPLSDLLLVSLL